MVAFFEPKLVDFSPTPSVSLQSVQLEEAVLGAILLDPEAIAQVQGLPLSAFSISAHRQIFRVMRDLHSNGQKPDLLTVALMMSESGTLKEIGGQSKLASLLERTVHSGCTKQYARLLQEKYFMRYLSESLSRIARECTTQEDFGTALQKAQLELDKIPTVTGDTSGEGDTPTLETARLSRTVTRVTKILEQGLPEWIEQAHLDALPSELGISKASFAALVASLRCQSDEVLPTDEQQLGKLLEWKNAGLNFFDVLPHLAEDLLQSGRVLCIDPVLLWQYLLPTTLSLVGKKVSLDVGSHRVPAIAWTCSVAESGTGKSRAEGLILSPLKAWQEEEHQRFKSEWSAYKASQHKKGEEDAEAVMPPVPERKFLFEVATIQAVMRRLSEQGENGSLWARDEIAGLFKSLNQFTAKGEGEGLECLLPMWDGASASVDRVLHEDSYTLASVRLSIAGGLQPGAFRQSFSDPDDAQGLQARFLFALPKVQLAKRVKGYCRLADKLPQFYRWVDTQFPAGTIKLSITADARYDAVYEQIGRSAESISKPAIRAWMRKLPGQLLRIALALHIIECYHEPARPKHEIQLDTLNRAIEFARYYRSCFQVIQESAADSDDISSILVKIWDAALTCPTGLAVRDAYRQIKAISRRAKELGRNVAAYTLDLFHQLSKMGRGTVERQGRLVRFVTGKTSPPTTASAPSSEGVTVVTVAETTGEQVDGVSPPPGVSPVTDAVVEQVSTVSADSDVENLSTTTASDPSRNFSPTGIEAALACEEMLDEEELHQWHQKMQAVKTLDQAMDFYNKLDTLSPKQRHQFEQSVPESRWAWLWNLPNVLLPSQQPESEPAGATLEYESPPSSPPAPQPTLEELKALLLACESLIQLNDLKRKHKKTISIAYRAMSEDEQAQIDAVAALAVPYRVFKYLGEEIRQGQQRLLQGMLVYLDPQTSNRVAADSAQVWAINGVGSGWKQAMKVSFSWLQEIVKDVKQDGKTGGSQMGWM